MSNRSLWNGYVERNHDQLPQFALDYHRKCNQSPEEWENEFFGNLGGNARRKPDTLWQITMDEHNARKEALVALLRDPNPMKDQEARGDAYVQHYIAAILRVTARRRLVTDHFAGKPLPRRLIDRYRALNLPGANFAGTWPRKTLKRKIDEALATYAY